jgi:flagellar basal body rod protein FlgG
MITAERAYQSAAEVTKIYDELIRKATEDVGRL